MVFLPWPGPASSAPARGESQRDSVPKPRVARHELPWGTGPQIISNRNAVAAMPSPFHTCTKFATPALRLMIGRTMTQGRRRCANLGLEADAPSGHSIHGRDRFHPVTLQSLWGESGLTGTLAMRDASVFATAPVLAARSPQGLIRDGVETVPTAIG